MAEEIDENALNDAGWVFLDHTPKAALTGAMWNGLKPALREAIRHYLRETQVFADAQRYRSLQGKIDEQA